MGNQLLLVDTVRDQAVLAADIASFYRVELKGECRTAALCNCEFRISTFSGSISSNIRCWIGTDVVFFHSFHENT